jgi:hypothetical protein
MVQRRSRAESTREAMRERESEWKTAPIFAARRNMFAITLILAYLSFCSVNVGDAYIDGYPSTFTFFRAPFPLVIRKKGFYILAYILQCTRSLCFVLVN